MATCLAKFHRSVTAPALCGVSTLQILNVVGYVVFLATSGAGGAGLGGLPSIGRTSNELPVTVTPAGFAFGIWSVIFALLGVTCVLQALPSNREWSSEKLGYWWLINTLVAEGLWTFAFVLRWGGMWVSAALLLTVVVTAAAIHLQMDAGVAPFSSHASPAPGQSALSLWRARTPVGLVELVFAQGGVSIYMGWTTAATILNISIALSVAGVSDSENGDLAQVVVSAAAVLAVVAAVTRLDFFFCGALCWALAGIHANQMRLGLADSFPAAAAASRPSQNVSSAKAAAFAFSVSKIVSMRMMSTPPSTSPRICSS